MKFSIPMSISITVNLICFVIVRTILVGVVLLLLVGKNTSIDQARIQAKNIAIKLMNKINGILQPVVLLDGSIVLIFDLKNLLN